MKPYVWKILIGLAYLLPTFIRADEPKAPVTVKQLWADFDPRKDDIDAKLVREWEKDGIVYRYVTYHIGTFKDKPARMAAFYAFPKNGKVLPAPAEGQPELVVSFGGGIEGKRLAGNYRGDQEATSQ